MKIIPFLSVSLLSLSLYAAIGSSVRVPTEEHLKYTFGNHKNHPIQKIEAQRYYHSLGCLWMITKYVKNSPPWAATYPCY